MPSRLSLAAQSVEPVIAELRQPRILAAPLAAAMAVVWVALGSASVHAQSQAPSAKARSSTDRVMTRNELRTCLKESDTLQADKVAVEAERGEVTREKAAVLKERDDVNAAFQAAVVALRGERETIDVKSEEAVNAYNQKAASMQKTYDERRQAADARIDAWNKRNLAATERERAYNDAQQQWKEGCGSRRFREDDEKAIRAGK